MLNYVNEFYCASSTDGESYVIKFIQRDVNFDSENPDGEIIEVASLVMNKDVATNLVCSLAELIPELKEDKSE